MKVRNFTITIAELDAAALNEVIEIDTEMSYTWEDVQSTCGGDRIRVWQPGQIMIRNENSVDSGLIVGYNTIQGDQEYREYTDLKDEDPEIFGFVALHPCEKTINPNTNKVTKVLIKKLTDVAADGDIVITGMHYRSGL